jgi:two-component system response regulator PilR (NtrC family)
MAYSIIIADDEQIIRESISFILRKEGYEVSEAANGKEALNILLKKPVDVIISDLEMPEMKGIELLEQAISVNPQVIFLIITAYGSLETAIAALRKGASDYILKPIEFDELLLKIKRLLDYKKVTAENQYLRREMHREIESNNIVGASPAIEHIRRTIETIAQTNSNVLVSGKSGTGKDLVARSVHLHSERSSMPFITVNCGAIPETLIESELFGHKKGSFTGAVADKIGYFKAADGGTLFLDEISEMPFQLQVKLLRAIEQKEIVAVGTSSAITVDARIIASTNRNLAKEVEEGRFRKDLYYRLNVVEIHTPSLAERTSDIPLLVDFFVNKYRKEMKRNVLGVNQDVMNVLMQHTWEGEIRELENIIERAMIFSSSEMITLKELPEELRAETAAPLEDGSLESAKNRFERKFISSALERHDYDKEETATELHISVPTLYRRIKDLAIGN